MKSKVKLHMWRVISLMMLFSILGVAACGDSSLVNGRLDTAENIMENRPNSALAILDSIHVSDLHGKSQKARYALLKSMALDKNNIDTTTFEILQPAVDYYLENGTPDEKLRTYYYQGRIYQNRNERDSALHSYMRGLDIADDCRDSLTIARTLVVQGIIYQSFYDFDGYTNNYLRAADIFHGKHNRAYEFECLLNALNGLDILGNNEAADSVIGILNEFSELNDSQRERLLSHEISHLLKFGSHAALRAFTNTHSDDLNKDTNSILNLVRVYSGLGDNEAALKQLDYLDKINANYDTLRYLSIKYPILEALGAYEEALNVYKTLVDKLEVVNSAKFEQKSQSIEERHRMELAAERDAMEHHKTKWELGMLVGVLLLVIIILLLSLRSYHIKKELALEQTRATEAENGKLKAENEAATENARATELENRNLKTEKEKLVLANKNLELERDKKALEAENLAHRVMELEGESENLRELLETGKEMPKEVRKAIRTRIEMLNSYLASQISDHKEFEKAYDAWVEQLTADKEEFMDSNRLAFQASHPAFIKYFEDHGLTTAEINYVCLYAIGLRGKDVGNYMKMRSHVNVSSAIRRKLGIDRHETNIGIYVRKKLQEF